MLRNVARACLLLCLAVFGVATLARAQKDKIEGLWYNDKKSAKIQIYKAVDGKFWGKIVWLREPMKDGKPRMDAHNSKEKLRNTPLMGLPILRGFKKDGENTYDDGEIYDPANGKTYSCIITYRSNNELGIRGYIGISMIGRTTTWTRAEG